MTESRGRLSLVGGDSELRLWQDSRTIRTSICEFCAAYSASNQTGTGFRTASRNRCRDLTHPTKLIILKRLLDFGVSVHHKRAATDYRLGNGFSGHH